MLSLDVMCESRSLFLEIWWHKGWQTVPGRALATRLKRELFEVSFAVDKISGLQDVMLTPFFSRECAVKIVLLKHGYSRQKQWVLYNIGVDLLLSAVDQMRQEPGASGALRLSQRA